MRRFLVLLGLLLLVGMLLPAAPAHANEYVPMINQPPGSRGDHWVAAQAVRGGCRPDPHVDGEVVCNSYLTPSPPALFEFLPARTPVRRGEAPAVPSGRPGRADHGGSYETWSQGQRQQCGDAPGNWAAGTWHLGAYWSRMVVVDRVSHGTYVTRVPRTVWSGPSRIKWAFEHNDRCGPPVPGQVQPTPTHLPESEATGRPGRVSFELFLCDYGQTRVPIHVRVGANGWSAEATGTTVIIDVPVDNLYLDYTVSLLDGELFEQGQLPRRGAYRQVQVLPICDRLGNQSSDAGGTGEPTEEPPAEWFGVCVSGDLARAPAQVTVDQLGGVVATRYDSLPSPAEWPVDPPPETHVVEPGSPVTMRIDFTGLRRTYEAGHRYESELSWGIRDVTAGTPVHLAYVGTDDQWQPYRVAPFDGTYTLQVARLVLAPGVTYGGSSVYASWNRGYEHWNAGRAAPFQGAFLKHTNVDTISFVPQEGHLYELWSVAGYRDCPPPDDTGLAYTWQRLLLRAGAPADPAPTPTPAPSPTPLPPPAPVPQASVAVGIHSSLDPLSADGITGNAIYRAADGVISWPIGEVLDVTPRLRVSLTPPQPAYPGYAFRARVLGWALVSIAGQPASAADLLGRQGCRPRAEPRQPLGFAQGSCAYRYIGGQALDDPSEPGEADMATQLHLVWAPRPPATLPAEVYALPLPPAGAAVPVTIQAAVAVEVWRVPDALDPSVPDAPISTRVEILTRTFQVQLVAPHEVQ